MVDLAVQLISNKSAAFHPEKFEDHYQTALKELVQEKLKGRRFIAAPEASHNPSGDVVDADGPRLRASIKGKKPSKPRPAKSRKKSA